MTFTNVILHYITLEITFIFLHDIAYIKNYFQMFSYFKMFCYLNSIVFKVAH